MNLPGYGAVRHDGVVNQIRSWQVDYLRGGEAVGGLIPDSCSFRGEQKPMRVYGPGFGMVVHPASFAAPTDIGSLRMGFHPRSHLPNEDVLFAGSKINSDPD